MAIDIEKQPNGTYKVRVWSKNKDIFGKRKTKQKSNIKTIAVAQKTAAIMEDELDNDKDYDNLTFSQLNYMYLEKRKDKMSPSTIYVLNRLIPNILEYLGNVKVKNINTKVVQNYIDNLALKENSRKPGEKLKKGTLQRYYRHIQAVLNWGVGQDLVEINRVYRVEFPDDEEPFEPTILSAQQIGKMLAYLKQNFYNIYIPVLISVTLSPRRGEALALQWDAIDFDNDTIDIRKNLVQIDNKIIERSRLKTAKSKRLLSLSDFVKQELLEHKEMCKGINSPYVCANVFTGEIPTPDYITHTFHDVIKSEFNIDMRLHDLRHSFNQLGYENNIDDLTRSKIMGHSSTKMTNDTYTHFSISKSKQAMNIISNAIQSSLDE